MTELFKRLLLVSVLVIGTIRADELSFSAAKAWQRGFERRGDEIVLETTDDKEGAGARWTLTFNQTVPAPVRISAESCGETLADDLRGWDIFVDVYYMDGTKEYGVRSAFDPAVRGWQRRTVEIASPRPIRALGAYLRLRAGTGRVRFRAPRVEEDRPDPSMVSFAGARAAESDLVRTNAFLLRDVAAYAPFRSVRPGETRFGVRFGVVSEGVADVRRFDVTLESTDEADHVLTLVQPVPLGTGDWDWCGTPRREIPFARLPDDPVVAYDDRPGFRLVSRYALGGARCGRKGVALGISPEAPCVYRVSADRETRTLFIAFDVALTKERRTARFGFVRFAFDGHLAFRGALERYMALYSAAFEVRAKRQGLMMAFAPIGKVERYEDFGFRFKEADYETDWDDAHGILTFHYNEPCTWWMKMPRGADGRDATYGECVAEAERLFRAGDPRAVAHRLSAMKDAAGRPVGRIRNTPWCDGIVWSECDVPGVGGEKGGFAVKLGAAELAKRWPTVREGERGLDGEFVDSAELWVSPTYDFNRANFARTERPLAFEPDSLRPAIYNGLVAFEYCRAASDASHRRGGLSMANATPTRWAWSAMQMDVMCTEVNWKRGGAWTPTSDDDLIHKRATIGAKPYNLLMNTDFAAFTYADSERYFNRAMAYGMFPSYFSGDASTKHFFRNPERYNAVRPLFVKYLPVIRRVAEAGWRPVNRRLPLAAETGVLAEQFGESLVTLFNPSAGTPRTVSVPPCRELVSGTSVAGDLVVPPERCLVLSFE